MQKLTREFYSRDTIVVAQDLLGKYLVHQDDNTLKVGKIVEVEAYLGPNDLAAHSSKGITKRTQIMFGPAGYVYVYQIYGMYFCLNVVTEKEGSGSAILIRALEPIKNITDRTQGPGLLCKALNINKTLNGHDLTSDSFYIARPDDDPEIIISARPRIGVAYAKDWANKLLGFYIQGNPFVSRLSTKPKAL